MTTTAIAPSALTRRVSARTYWIVTGLFCLMFIGSGLSYFVDYAGAAESFVRLGYPERLLYWLAVAKLAGAAVILWGRWPTLTLFAFAGFLFDLLLALHAHIATSDPFGFVAALALLLWGGAFWVHQHYPRPTL